MTGRFKTKAASLVTSAIIAASMLSAGADLNPSAIAAGQSATTTTGIQIKAAVLTPAQTKSSAASPAPATATATTTVTDAGKAAAFPGDAATAFAPASRPAAAPAGLDAAASAEATEDAAEAQKKAGRLQKIQQLTFDRRPSAIFRAWSQKPDANKSASSPAQAAAPNPAPSPVMPTIPEGLPASARAALLASAAASGASSAATSAADAAALEEFAKELTEFQRDVTLSQWSKVKSYLAKLPSDEGKALYKKLLQSLPSPMNAAMMAQRGMVTEGVQSPMAVMPGMMSIMPGMMPSGMPVQPQLAAYMEKNMFTARDLTALASASPAGLDRESIAALGAILNAAISGGTAIESFLAQARYELVKPEEEQAFTRGELARLLLGANQVIESGEFLPELDDALAGKDRETLNLMARYYLALYAKQSKISFLEQAWTATQAILALGEAEGDAGKTEKEEALRRAVETAPKVRKEFGQAWLEESFAKHPERGMEILAAIGTAASQGLTSRPQDSEFRLKSLELQRAAVDALMKADPKRAETWGRPLTLLAASWLKEAEYSALYDTSTSRSPMARRDVYGNFFYYDFEAMQQQYQRPNMIQAIPTPKLLQAKPSAAWMGLVDEGLTPSIAAVSAKLHLKIQEEAEAFPFIERIAATNPDAARLLVDEFLQVWSKNHSPNATSQGRNPYIFIYGFEERASGIPLTRSKQERNLKELADWVVKLRKLPLGKLNERLLTQAFTTCHSSAEVYRVEAIEAVFGSMADLKPETLAELAQQMRTNLAGVWRSPAEQQQKKTNRKKQDIQAEVLRGYEVARNVIDKGLRQYPDHWSLTMARATLDHDELNYRQEIQRSSEFTTNRKRIMAEFEKAASLYAKKALDLTETEESTDAYDYWFYASLGDCDIRGITEDKLQVTDQPAKIRQAIQALPGETAKRHLDRFANNLFNRMGSLNPAVKFRYLRGGFEIVGDHERALEARKVYDYYKDLNSELKLEAELDGNAAQAIGAGKPFGVFVNIRHTREIERESGGFAKYLQNQQSGMYYYYNYGRPLNNYRERFEEMAKNALSEHFEVVSVTFHSDDVHSRATPEYGWRRSPYAYLLLKPRGPEVDKLPPLRLDFDFLDTSGYVVLPVESASLPIKVAERPAPYQPLEKLKITQTLDERQAKDGKLVLEVKAVGRGLVPDLDDLLQVKSEGFRVVKTEDQGLSVSEFDKEAEEISIVSERNWMITLQAENGETPAQFTFAKAVSGGPEMVYQRYEDADLKTAPSQIGLEAKYGEASYAWVYWTAASGIVGVALLAAVVIVLINRQPVTDQGRFAVPDRVSPFTVIGLLRDIEQNNGLTHDRKRELAESIQRLERHYFVEPANEEPDLRRIAETWVRAAG